MDACKACNGMGWGEIDPDFGYRNNGVPCSKCNSDADGRAPGAAAKPATKTVAGVDAPVDPAKAAETGMTLDEAVEQGLFSEAEADASIAEELAASAEE
jgi:hypothetical protein